MHTSAKIQGKTKTLFYRLKRAGKRGCTAWQLATAARTHALSTYVSELRTHLTSHGWTVKCILDKATKDQRIYRYWLKHTPDWSRTFDPTPMSRLSAMIQAGKA